MNVTLLSDLLVPPLTGVGRYAYELAAHLQQQPAAPALSFVSYRGEETWADIARRFSPEVYVPAAEPGRNRLDTARLKTWLVNTSAGALGYATATRLQYTRFSPRFAKSLVHAPTLQKLPSAQTCQKRVVTVHDASHVVNPDWHPHQRVRRLDAALSELARVDRVIAVSQATADALIERGFVPADAVRVIHNGVSPLLGSRFGQSDDGARRGVVCVSTIEPRKNVGTLLRAYSTLPNGVLKDHPLTLIGDYGWKSGDIHAHIQTCRAAGWLRYPGFVPDTNMAATYAHARLAVYPSLYEGFGLPILEAFALGTPVIAGNHSSIPEVAGGHAHLLNDVTDVDEMREAILTHLRAPWDAKGSQVRAQYARHFSWQRVAAQTIEAYRQVLGSPGA